MWAVSERPVMKITGTSASPASRLSRRQVSKPSMPGMTASSSTISGVICSAMRMAPAPSSATITVMPTPSRASVRSRSVSGLSSTTRATSRFLASDILGSGVMRLQRLEEGHVLIEIEAVDQHAHLRDEGHVFGMVGADLVELHLDGTDVTHFAEADELIDMMRGRAHVVGRPVLVDTSLIAVVAP